MKNKSSNTLWGVIFILFGLCIAGKALNLWHFNLFFNGWWTLFIIIPCVVSVAQHGFNPVPTAGLVIGLLLLFSAWGIFPSGFIFKMFFPIMLVVIGFNLVFKDSMQKNKFKASSNVQYQQDMPDYVAIFSGQKITCDNEAFTGANMNAIFGGIDLNLRNAYLQEDIVVNCTAVFGGIDIFIPKGINVKVSCVPIFGGVSNRCRNNIDGAPTLFINATCMFGGIDIK